MSKFLGRRPELGDAQGKVIVLATENLDGNISFAHRPFLWEKLSGIPRNDDSCVCP